MSAIFLLFLRIFSKSLNFNYKINYSLCKITSFIYAPSRNDYIPVTAYCAVDEVTAISTSFPHFFSFFNECREVVSCFHTTDQGIKVC